MRVSILIDASGSMQGATVRPGPPDANGRRTYVWVPSNASTCAQTARDLAMATDLLPWVKADVSAFTTGNGNVVVFPLWKIGDDTANIDAYGLIPMNGTEEGYAIAFAKDEMQERIAGREQGLIIIISDGAPSEPAHVKWVVEECRNVNIPVVSVALVDNAAQPAMYGRENVVKYDGNARVLARRGRP